MKHTYPIIPPPPKTTPTFPRSDLGKSNHSSDPFPRSDLGKQGNKIVRWSKKRVWDCLGKVLFYITWPGIWLVIRFTPPRTRAVIECNGQVLLVRDWLGNGEWGLPGGGLHRGEKIAHGVLREVQEETGIKLASSDIQWVNRFQMKSAGIMIRYEVFHARLSHKPEIRLKGFEVAEAVWVDIGQVSKYQNSSATQAILEAFAQD